MSAMPGLLRARLLPGCLLPVCLLLPAVAAAREPTPECARASKAHADHEAECRALRRDCSDGNRAACNRESEACGIVADAAFVDAAYAACGQPRARPAAPPPATEPEHDSGGGKRDAGYGKREGTEAKAAKSSKPTERASSHGPRIAFQPPTSGVHVFGGRGCSLCVKLRRELEQAGLSYQFHDIDREPGAEEYALANGEYLYNNYIVLLVCDGRPRKFEFGRVAEACRRQ
jgi:hypothetical protein